MDIHIDLNDIGLFLSIVVFGAAHSWYWFRKGLRKGWDDLAWSLSDENIILVADDGEIKRVSDNEYRKYKENLSYSDT
jgi:hypothetical protein